MNLPYEDDGEEEEHIYIPKGILTWGDLHIPRPSISNITAQEIEGIFPRDMRVESCKIDVNDDEFVKSIPFKKLLW